MTEAVQIALIASIPPTLVGLAALWKVIRVHTELNSRLEQWKEETRLATKASNIAAKAEGVLEEKERPKQ